MTRGLIAHWPLDDAPGAGARDVSGSELHGTVGASVLVGAPGRMGTAMGFAREATAWTQRLRDLEARIAGIDAIDAIESRAPAPASLGDLSGVLETRGAVLVHFADSPAHPDSVTAWVVGAPGREAVVPVALVLDDAWREARAALIDELAAGRSRRPDATRARSLARDVAKSLWDPVADVIGNAPEVWLRLTPELHAIPFAALVARDGAFLVERVAFARCGPVGELARRQGRPQRAPARALAIANPDLNALGDKKATGRPPGTSLSSDRMRFGSDGSCTLRGAPLLGTEREAALVADMLLGAGARVDVYEWDGAQEEQLDRAIGGADVVHVATHGYRVDPGCLSAAPTDPLCTSGVILAGALRHVPDGYRGGDEGLLSAAEVAGFDLSRAELVVWSACATATGVALPGEPMCGLVAAAWLAGAGASVATLWPVSDDAMPDRIVAFYAQWLAGESPARALRAALNAGREATRRDRGHDHPAWWAAMIVEGM